MRKAAHPFRLWTCRHRKSASERRAHPLVAGDFHRGFTLLEVITVITLAGLFLARALPAGARLQDRMAVVAAREAAVGLFHRSRLEAVAHGGAALTLTADPGRVVLSAHGRPLEAENLQERWGVSLVLSRGRREIMLSFDAMGLGRVASQTIRFTRGMAKAELVVSSYGRITRR